MELLPYQQQVLRDLADFLAEVERLGDLHAAFAAFWRQRGVARPEDYHDSLAGTPHVCIKVPTGGGKTFIAANALKTIFDALRVYARPVPRAVVWLVPSNAILEQTERSLGKPGHPYRRKLDTLFNGRARVYTKEELLEPTGFNPASVHEQVNIFVLSYASFRTSNKQGRKAYQENPALRTFTQGMRERDMLPETDPTALINVLRAMQPVCIVDESHNAGSMLSREMLGNFNPSLILDLTATPRARSNILVKGETICRVCRHPARAATSPAHGARDIGTDATPRARSNIFYQQTAANSGCRHPARAQQHHQLRGRGPTQGQPHGQAAGDRLQSSLLPGGDQQRHPTAQRAGAPSGGGTAGGRRLYPADRPLPGRIEHRPRGPDHLRRNQKTAGAPGY